MFRMCDEDWLYGSELCVGKDVQESGHDLISCYLTPFAWRNQEKYKTFQDNQ
jgi:hypothetical protein